MDAEYCIMCAAELGELTPLESLVLFGAQPAYNAIRVAVDNNLAMPERFMENTARSFLDSTSKQERYFWALRALKDTELGLKLIGERAEGLLKTKVLRDLGVAKDELSKFYDHFPEVHAALADDKLTDGSQVTEQWARRVLNKHFIGFRRRLAADLAFAEEALVWYGQDNGQTYRAMAAAHDRKAVHRLAPERQDATVAALTEQVMRLRKRKAQQQESYLRRKARAAIKKATQLFCKLGQEKNLKLFVTGKEVEISNDDSPFKFVLKPLHEANWLEQRSLKGHSHTPYDLALLTKDNVHLARLCVYFDDTPVLDQLLALTLFVEAGDEMELLQKANWFGFSDLETTRSVIETTAPALISKLPRPLVPMTDDEEGLGGIRLADGRVVRIRSPITEQMRKEDEAWDAYKGRVAAWIGTWFDPVKDQLAMLGPQAPQLAA